MRASVRRPWCRQADVRQFLRLVARTPTLLCLMGAFMCANFVAVVLLSWMPKFLFDKFQMSLAMAGLTATVFVQLASMVGAPLGGWLADAWRRRSPRGRLAVQMIGVLGGAPFVALCGLTPSVGTVIAALTFWGLFKGLYDANIFASVFDVVRPEARGTAAGFMNAVRMARRRRQRAARHRHHRRSARASAWRSRSRRSSTSPQARCSWSRYSSSSARRGADAGRTDARIS